MKKKIIKLITSALPQLYNIDGEIISRRLIADKIYDAIPNPEKLDIEPFNLYIPKECSVCTIYNQAYKMGCTYNMFSETYHKENPAPDNCPLDY